MLSRRLAHATRAVAFTVLVLASTAPQQAHALLSRNAEERAIAKLAAQHPQQRRPRMSHDAYLHLVARAKAQDMAKRNYFGHADQDGIGPNHVIRMTGYKLPDWYPADRRANSVESIAAGTNYDADAAFRAWMKSPGHRQHLLASESFYREQTRFGVGYARSAGSRYKNYYVFISAPPSTKPLPVLSKSKIELFLGKTPRQIERTLGKRR